MLVLEVDKKFHDLKAFPTGTSGVYGLLDPVSRTVRYVGSSVHIERRLYAHNHHGAGSLVNPREIWIRDMRRAGWSIDAAILQKISPEFFNTPKKRHLIEEVWIEKYHGFGQADLNVQLRPDLLSAIRRKQESADKARIAYLEGLLKAHKILFT